MTDKEYQLKLNQCKSQVEKDKLNDKYLKSRVRKNHTKKFFTCLIKYIKDNHLIIIDIIVGIIALIIALIK